MSVFVSKPHITSLTSRSIREQANGTQNGSADWTLQVALPWVTYCE